jgi:hypothetical protein
MAALASTTQERRTSTFLSNTKVDAQDKSEWAKMSNNNTLKFNDSLPTTEELSNVQSLRKELGTLMTEGDLSKQPENVSDYKLLRFLRGYEDSVTDAAAAYREMATYRAEHNFNALRQKLVDNYQDPNLWEEYQPIIQLMPKGLRYEHGMDFNGNVLTVTDIGALDLRAIISNDLQDLYCELCLMTEEYSNLRLHEMTVQRGRLVARHDLINVSNFGLFQWNKACYDMLTTVFAGNKHYPECVVRISSCGNGSVAVVAWKVMKHFVPERTKQKLAVFGTVFLSELQADVPFNRIPLCWGGGSVGNGTPDGFDAAWSEACTNKSIVVGRRDVKVIKIGCFEEGVTVKYSWALSGYSIKVSSHFAAVNKDAGVVEDGNSGESKENNIEENAGETKEMDEKGPSREVVGSLPLVSVDTEETIESSSGRQTGQFVAPSSGVFALKFDNTFSMLRSKTIELSISVDEATGGAEEEESEGGTMTF